MDKRREHGPWGAPKPGGAIFLSASLLIALAIAGIGWLLTGGAAR